MYLDVFLSYVHHDLLLVKQLHGGNTQNAFRPHAEANSQGMSGVEPERWGGGRREEEGF